MRSVCVFCGSNRGTGDAYADAARKLARAIAGRGLRLVYGGGSVGLMGVLGEAALAAGGHVTGVTPQHRAMFIFERDPESVLDRLASAPLPEVSKWMDGNPA